MGAPSSSPSFLIDYLTRHILIWKDEPSFPIPPSSAPALGDEAWQSYIYDDLTIFYKVACKRRSKARQKARQRRLELFSHGRSKDTREGRIRVICNPLRRPDGIP